MTTPASLVTTIASFVTTSAPLVTTTASFVTTSSTLVATSPPCSPLVAAAAATVRRGGASGAVARGLEHAGPDAVANELGLFNEVHRQDVGLAHETKARYRYKTTRRHGEKTPGRSVYSSTIPPYHVHTVLLSRRKPTCF